VGENIEAGAWLCIVASQRKRREQCKPSQVQPLMQLSRSREKSIEDCVCEKSTGVFYVQDGACVCVRIGEPRHPDEDVTNGPCYSKLRFCRQAESRGLDPARIVLAERADFAQVGFFHPTALPGKKILVKSRNHGTFAQCVLQGFQRWI
jgi:hypothetical protein